MTCDLANRLFHLANLLCQRQPTFYIANQPFDLANQFFDLAHRRLYPANR